MKSSRQTTLRSQATVTGVGVHSGLPVSLTLGPASIDAGFIFARPGADGSDRRVRAIAKSVTSTEFATVLGDQQGPLVSTAEHVLAALRGMGVDNATIEVDGPEVPIMDGSSAAFVGAVDQAGSVEQAAPRRVLQVWKPVRGQRGNAFGESRAKARRRRHRARVACGSGATCGRGAPTPEPVRPPGTRAQMRGFSWVPRLTPGQILAPAMQAWIVPVSFFRRSARTVPCSG